MDKVLGGTPRGFVSLCVTCRSAHIIRGMNLQHEVFCRAMPQLTRIGFPVENCSIYDDKRNPSLYEMEQIAWEVKSRNRAPMGFSRNGERDVVIEPPNKNPYNVPSQPPTGEKQ